jgi:ribonucleoside-diphosphate reductase subunit M2
MTSTLENLETPQLTPCQAASAIESFKMESPVEQPLFSAQADKENTLDSRYESDEVAVPIKGIPMMTDEPAKQPEVAPTLKEEEASEPILQENPNRFVLFPIKYHEVRTRLYIPNRVSDALSGYMD